MRLLVTGGRHYNDSCWMFEALDVVNARLGPIEVLIHGAAEGADQLASMWAMQRGVKVMAYPAQWAKYGPSAGPQRNAQMLDVGRPDYVLAVPGGRGTADMVRKAKAARVKVITPETIQAS